MSKTIAEYQLIAELKRGHFATVYRAYEAGKERFVLLKVLHDAAMRARLQNEAAHLAQLQHDNLVRVLRYGETQTPAGKRCAFLALEFIEGPTLAEIMHERKLPPDIALHIAREILLALNEAHRRQIVHRDLKPQNILINIAGRVKVTDFGLAAALGRSENAGEIVGTPQYMSPEQARGELVTPASDLFSLGVVLYEMLTGVSPFAGESMVERIYRVTHETPAPLTRVLEVNCARLSAFVQRLLEKESARRFADAPSALQELHVCEVELRQRAKSEDLCRYLQAPEQYQPHAYQPRAARGGFASNKNGYYVAFALLCALVLIGAWRISQHEPESQPQPENAPAMNHVQTVPANTQPSETPNVLSRKLEPTPTRGANDSARIMPNAETETLPASKPELTTSYLRLTCWPMAYAVLNEDTLGQVEVEPSRFEVPAGKHVLTLLNPRFPAITQTLHLTVGDTLDYKISLWEKVAVLTLNVQPWAEVSIDEKIYGKTPLGEIMLAPGAHTFTFTHPERETFVLHRTFVAGRRDTLNIELQKK